MAGIIDTIRKGLRRGRRAGEPTRDTILYPRLDQLGRPRDAKERPAYKPIARNLRYFSRTPYARRAINRIKNLICQLDWEVVPLVGIDWTPELRKQAEVATYCFENPNHDDSFRTLAEAVLEDVQCGAGAIETQLSGDPLRPLWLYPVDGLSIQIYPGWDGDPAHARYLQTVGYGGLGNLGFDGIKLRNDELIYVRPNPNTMDPFGVGPLEVAFMSIARLLGTTEHAGNVATNARPSIAFWLKNADDRVLNAFRAYWRNEIEGQGNTPIIGAEDAEAIKLYPDGDKALFLEWQKFLIQEIAVAFDLSPMSLGDEQMAGRSTAEVVDDREWANTIRPNAKNLAAYLTREALHGRLGFHQLRFKFLGMDRDDELATAQIYQIYYECNAIVPNEQRDKLGWPKSTDPFADMTYTQAQLILDADASNQPGEARKRNRQGGTGLGTGGKRRSTNPGGSDPEPRTQGALTVGIPFHIINMKSATLGGATEKVDLAYLQLANGAGTAAGAAVTVAATFPDNFPNSTYAVFFDPGQDAVAFASAKTASGFTVTVEPRLGTSTLGAGTVNALVMA